MSSMNETIDESERRRRAGISAHRKRVGKQGGDGGQAGLRRRMELANAFAKQMLPHAHQAAERIRQQGGFASNVAIAESLNQSGHRTSRGCLWTAKQVERLLSREKPATSK